MLIEEEISAHIFRHNFQANYCKNL